MSHDHDRLAIMHVKCPSCREILLTAYDARHRRAGRALAEVAAMDEADAADALLDSILAETAEIPVTVVTVPTLGERVAQLPTDPGETHPCTGPSCAGLDLPAAVAGFLAETTAGQARTGRDRIAADQESEATA